MHNIQTFLKNRLDKLKYNRKVFARKSGIPYTTVISISNGMHANPSINNILKIAQFFNCQIDEIFGRMQYIDNKLITYNDIDHHLIMQNLQTFLKEKSSDNMNMMNLSIALGCSYKTLYSFVSIHNKRKIVSSKVLVLLADYFNCSIDHMIGRI